MSTPYKSGSTGESWVWFGVVFLGLVGTVGVIILLHPYEQQVQGWILLFAVLPFILMIIVALMITGRMKRRRLADIKTAMESRGLYTETSVTDAIRAHLDPHINSLNPAYDLRHGAASLQWVAYNDQMLVFEHEFTTGSGKSTQIHRKTVVAWSRTDPNRQWIIAVRPRFGETISYKRRLGKETELGDDGFDKRWLLYGSEETLNRFLSFDVREMLADSPKGECWYVDHNWFAVGFPSILDAENLERFIERGERMISGK